MCPSIYLDAVTLPKSLALILGLLISTLTSYLLHERTHFNAVDVLLLAAQDTDPEGHDKLNKLLEWRDLIIGGMCGVFALNFTAAEKLASGCTFVANVAQVVVFGLVPVMLLTIVILVSKLQLRHIRSSLGYWLLFSAMVLPWYTLSFFFVFSR